MVNVGIDFDGVLADSARLKIKLAKEVFGLDLTPALVSKKKILALGITSKRYNKTFRKILSSKERYKIELVPSAKRILNKLYRKHKVYIITSRHKHEVPYVRDWLSRQKIKYHVLINTSDKSKNHACVKNNIRVYLDDEMHKLEQIRNADTKLFLLTKEYNKHSSVRKKNIKKRVHRVKDWDDFYKKIKCLL